MKERREDKEKKERKGNVEVDNLSRGLLKLLCQNRKTIF